MNAPSRGRITGPLAPSGAGFAAELERQGYTPSSCAQQVRLAAQLSCWLAAEGRGGRALEPAVIERFLESRRAAGHASHLTVEGLRPLLGYLRQLGAAPEAPAAVPEGPVESQVPGRGVGVRARVRR